MTTVYDWIAVGLFAGLVILFLDRSDRAAPPADPLWHYLIASIGCACVNWLGNNGRHIAAITMLLVVLTFIALVLRPLSRPH
jgi:hypothetical protein